MSFFDNLLNDKGYMLNAFADLIRQEGDRICKAGLANSSEIGDLLNSVRTTGHFPALHRALSEVKLPGDFEKTAADWYRAPPGVKPVGDKLHDLSELHKEKQTEDPEEELEDLQEALEDYVETVEQEDTHESLAKAICSQLERIANSLVQRNDQESAYKVERTIRAIKASADKKELF